MFIAHIPAGYIFHKFLGKKSGSCLWLSLLGSVFPDLDLIEFFLNGGQIHHHLYFTHWPLFWFLVLLLSECHLLSQLKNVARPFFANCLLHVGLDSIAGDVAFFAPFSMQLYHLFEVRREYEPWYLNFIFHWTALIEIAISLFSLGLYLRVYCKIGND